MCKVKLKSGEELKFNKCNAEVSDGILYLSTYDDVIEETVTKGIFALEAISYYMEDNEVWG